MNRIGTFTARATATTLPPFAVPSSLATTSPVSGTAPANARALCTALCPTLPSSTSSDSCGAPGCCFATTRTTFFNSSSNRSSVWSRPAVSTRTVSAPRARRRDGVEGHGRGIARARDRVNAQTAGPRLELLRGTGAKRVRRRQQHRPPVARQPGGELRHGRRLPHADRADHEDHRGRRGRSRQHTGSAGRRGDERRGHRVLERAPKVSIRARHLFENGLGRLHTEVGFEQYTLGRRTPRLPAPPPPYTRQPLPQAHQGSPWRRRHAHSAVKATMATTNSHQRSRSATPASRPPPPVAPGCAATTTGAGRHSSEYVSTATRPRSGPSAAA